MYRGTLPMDGIKQIEVESRYDRFYVVNIAWKATSY